VSDDIRTVIWKEWRSLIQGQSRRQLLVVVLTLAIWAIWLPFQTGADWMTDGVISILISVFLPAVVVAVTVPAAFAGERERKTLATLLATRLPDGAILFGKLVIPVVLGCTAMLAVLLLGLIVANAASWDGTPRFYDPVVIIPDVVIGFLVALMVAALGVRISLRSRRVQDAQQMISMMLMLPAMVLGALLFILAEMTGGVRETVARLEGVNGWLVAFGVIAILAVIDVILLVIARRRFRRSRLITML
jgi:ABC-2 type transport system permease protein